MKTYILSSLLLFTVVALKAQIAIGQQAVSNNSVSLEFATTEDRGLILPYVEDKSSITTNGSFIYDNTDHKVKYLKGGTWFDLSVDATGQALVTIQLGKTEQTTARTAIGANSSSDNTPGILVLSANDKAMVLPTMQSPHLKITNPAPGMMVYDSLKKQLAVYNGTVWSFWKP